MGSHLCVRSSWPQDLAPDWHGGHDVRHDWDLGPPMARGEQSRQSWQLRNHRLPLPVLHVL